MVSESESPDGDIRRCLLHDLETSERGKQVSDVLLNALNQRRRSKPSTICLDFYGNGIVYGNGALASWSEYYKLNCTI